mmetsp:Transcript_59660/g.182208  ORF Transcript_59660/g.182208 Transcript_59660/m.182208 type:complete len:232 (+) Transcript_59660:409-1104(+)
MVNRPLSAYMTLLAWQLSTQWCLFNTSVYNRVCMPLPGPPVEKEPPPPRNIWSTVTAASIEPFQPPSTSQPSMRWHSGFSLGKRWSPPVYFAGSVSLGASSAARTPLAAPVSAKLRAVHLQSSSKSQLTPTRMRRSGLHSRRMYSRKFSAVNLTRSSSSAYNALPNVLSLYAAMCNTSLKKPSVFSSKSWRVSRACARAASSSSSVNAGQSTLASMSGSITGTYSRRASNW